MTTPAQEMRRARFASQFGARTNHVASFPSDHALDLQFRAAALKNNLERT